MRFLRIAWAGFRWVASLLKILASHGKIERAPKPETLIQWELKIGLYKLERPKPADQEWVWMADHVIRLGSYKCFVIVGVRVATLRAKGDLTVSLEDLEPMAILPMKVSNGAQVACKLEETMQKVGLSPRGLVIDHGSDLYAGSRLVSERHPNMHIKYDVCHKVACELKRRLNTNAWRQMMTSATETKKTLLLSQFAKYAPPQQRSKARYMNLDTLVNWGYKMLQQYDGLQQKVQERTSWLLSLKQDIFQWREWVQIGQVTRDVIRKEGFYEGVENLLMDRIIEMNLSESSQDLIETLVDYVSAESEGIHYNERMIGTTEALEGLFGGYKRVVGDNKMSLNGLGRLILCMSSRVGKFSEEMVREAMRSVKHKDVWKWLDQAFGHDKNILEEKQEQSLEGVVCNF